jgi:type IV pilus assembly protein PilN
MIRINLLAIERTRPRRRQITSEAGQKITVASTLILVVAGLLVAWWFWTLQKESTRLSEEIVAAEQETARLRTIIVQVQEFEQRKAQIQQRVALIEQLRRGQSGPVHMLDEISRGMPDMLWLTEIEQKGAEVTLDGRCVALTSLSDFVANLENSGWFARPVEIVDSKVERQTGVDVELIRFTIKAQFKPPGGPGGGTGG